MENPLVSVVVPVYKVESYIERCIESVIHQTYSNLEILLVDDGSPDRCGFICDQFAKRDYRIKVFHKNHGGLSDTRNYALDRLTGDYVAFVDSDDWIEPDMCEVLVKNAIENDADICVCGHYVDFVEVEENVIVTKKMRILNGKEALQEILAVGNNEYMWNKLWRARLFDNVRLPYGGLCESPIAWKLFLKANAVLLVPGCYYHYMQTANSIIHNVTVASMVDRWIVEKERFDAVVAHDPEFFSIYLPKLTWAIARAWRWCYSSPSGDRAKYKDVYGDMSRFVRAHFREIMATKCSFATKICIVFAHYNNTLSYAVTYWLNQLYRARYAHQLYGE